MFYLTEDFNFLKANFPNSALTTYFNLINLINLHVKFLTYNASSTAPHAFLLNPDIRFLAPQTLYICYLLKYFLSISYF